VVSLEELYDRTVGRTEERNGDGARVLPL
jgi:hypothetical protein